MLSGYRLMWIAVMFDLPVVERAERKAATAFRNTLLDMGFEMAQFSVYMRFCTGQAQIDTYCKRVEAALPEGEGQHPIVYRQAVRTDRDLLWPNSTASKISRSV